MKRNKRNGFSLLEVIAAVIILAVVAAATGIVPLYDVPVMPTLPVDQSAVTRSVPSTDV